MQVPALGDSISEGTIVAWEKTVGDFVEADDVIAVVETDKVRIFSFSYSPFLLNLFKSFNPLIL